MNESWLTLSHPRPLPFEYTPLTPPTCLPVNPRTFFYSQLITTLPNFDSDPDNPDLISKLFHKDNRPEQEQDVCLSSTTTSKVLGRRQRILPKHQPVAKKRLVKSVTVPPTFPWVTSKHATVYTLINCYPYRNSRLSLELFCKFQQGIQIDLVEKLKNVTKFMEENMRKMHDRAPDQLVVIVVEPDDRVLQD